MSARRPNYAALKHVATALPPSYAQLLFGIVRTWGPAVLGPYGK